MDPRETETGTEGGEVDNGAFARTQAKRSKRLAQRLGLQANHRFDYKDPQLLKYFINERGKVVPRRISGLSARQQRNLTVAVKRARHIALLPYTCNL